MASPSTVTQLAEYLLQKEADTRGKRDGRHRFVVAVSGVPGAGKTYLSDRIGIEVNRLHNAAQEEKEEEEGKAEKEEMCVVLPMDGFHLTKAQLRAMDDPETAFARRGAPWTFDGSRFVEAVRSVSRDGGERVVLWPSFDHAVGDPVEAAIEVAESHRIVIVEGLYAHVNEDPWEPIGAQLADELWWIDSSDSFERMVERHVATGVEATHEKATRRVVETDSINGIYAETHRHPPTRCIRN
ncbi:hypothetical protein GGI11_000161 [Coemansia sp. RSA 2049]|nr:hypothetical protein GGI11_000161 [Coemansia sp. RSA 2049]